MFWRAWAWTSRVRATLSQLQAIQGPVVLGGAENPLHVILRLRERNVVHELVAVDAAAFRDPLDDPSIARVVGRQRAGHFAVELLYEIGEVSHADPDVRVRVGQF